MTFPFPVFVPMTEPAAPSGPAFGYAEYSDFGEFTAELPVDDTVPQVTEGSELLKVTVRPSSESAKILIRFSVFCQRRSLQVFNVDVEAGAWSITTDLGLALFRNSTCLHACSSVQATDDTGTVLSGTILDEPGTTSPVTYSVRIGGANLDEGVEGEGAPELPDAGRMVVVNGQASHLYAVDSDNNVVQEIGGHGRLFGGAAKATLVVMEL